MIPEDIEKWLADPKYGSDWQDVDLILADVEFLPRLITYLDDPSGTESKKIWILSALLELLEHECPRDGGPDIARLAENIRDTISQHADLAERAMSELGPIKEVVLRSILGLPVPSDYPQWVIDRAHERGAFYFMQRQAYTMKLKPGFAAEYKKRHDEIWPELALELCAAGVSDFSIFLDEQTLTLFAVRKIGNPAAFAKLPQLPIVRKWWDSMSPLMEVNADNSPKEWPLTEVFHLD